MMKRRADGIHRRPRPLARRLSSCDPLAAAAIDETKGYSNMKARRAAAKCQQVNEPHPGESCWGGERAELPPQLGLTHTEASALS